MQASLNGLDLAPNQSYDMITQDEWSATVAANGGSVPSEWIGPSGGGDDNKWRARLMFADASSDSQKAYSEWLNSLSTDEGPDWYQRQVRELKGQALKWPEHTTYLPEDNNYPGWKTGIMFDKENDWNSRIYWEAPNGEYSTQTLGEYYNETMFNAKVEIGLTLLSGVAGLVQRGMSASSAYNRSLNRLQNFDDEIPVDSKLSGARQADEAIYTAAVKQRQLAVTYGDLRSPYNGVKEYEQVNGRIIQNPDLQKLQPGQMAEPLEVGNKYIWAIDKDGYLRVGTEKVVGPGQNLGHPTLVYEDGMARVGGEIKYNQEAKVWRINDSSGRYSRGRSIEVRTQILQNTKQLFENSGLNVGVRVPK